MLWGYVDMLWGADNALQCTGGQNAQPTSPCAPAAALPPAVRAPWRIEAPRCLCFGCARSRPSAAMRARRCHPSRQPTPSCRPAGAVDVDACSHSHACYGEGVFFRLVGTGWWIRQCKALRYSNRNSAGNERGVHFMPVACASLGNCYSST